jgi:manganese-dependent inorganic pyrophosphatase
MDREAAESLASIAGLDMEEFSIAMFKAGSNMLEKSAEELFFQDFKQFKMGELQLGVGQVNSMDSNELLEVKDRILEYMNKVYIDKNLDMVLFMLTDILNERTELLFTGKNTELISKAFDGKRGKNSIMLQGVLSRKKQVIPPLLNCSME